VKRVVFSILLAACGSKRAAPPCEDLRPMVDRMFTIEFRELRGGMSPGEEQRVKEVGEQTAPAMKDAIVSACRADAWPADVVACMAAARSETALDECEARLPKPARDRVEAAMAEVVTNIAPPDEGAAADDEDFGKGESGVPECDAYAAAMEKYVDCDEIAEPVKDSAKKGLVALRQTWPMLRDPSTPASAKAAARDACARAREELEASAKAQGCKDEAPEHGDCSVMGPMIASILAQQLHDVPADKQAAAAAQAKALADPLERSLVETCTTGRWSAEATACFGKAHDAKALVACEAMLTPDQATSLANAMEQVTGQLTGSAAPSTACDDYLAAVNKLLACDKLPADDRARMQRSTALVIDGLKKLPSSRELGATCAKALDATTALSKKLGC